MDDKRLNGYNVDDVIKRFKKAAEDQRKHFTGNNIMMTMGSDFQYRNAQMWFKNLDKLIKYVNDADVGLNLFYSTPRKFSKLYFLLTGRQYLVILKFLSCYLKARNEENQIFEEKTDDFFPYADGPSMFWTGYFTSRAGLKGYVRETNSILNTCKQMNLKSENKFEKELEVLERAFAVAQHHDAVR